MTDLLRVLTETVYAWTAIIAAFFLAISVALGHDHDVDHDVDHDGGGHSFPIFSAKVILAFVAGFGAFGFFGARASMSPVGSAFAGLGGGLFFGAVVSAFMRCESESLQITDGDGTVVARLSTSSYGAILSPDEARWIAQKLIEAAERVTPKEKVNGK